MIEYKGYVIAENSQGEFQLRYNDEIMVFRSLLQAKTFVDWGNGYPKQPPREVHLCEVINLDSYRRNKT